MSTEKATLFYVHDPMCSWCYGFKKTWTEVQETLSTVVNIRLLLGGLAPDSNEPMPADMQSMLSQTWKLIEQRIPGTRFNYEFWESGLPRRSTWPSCRAVIAAREQSHDLEIAMIDAIQNAYYRQARNPSNQDVLIELAQTIGCNGSQFESALSDPATQEKLSQQMRTSRDMGVQGFPSLVLETIDGQQTSIPIHYTDSSLIVNRIRSVLSSSQ